MSDLVRSSRLPQGPGLPLGLFVILCVATITTLQGCAVNRDTASVSPDVDLSRVKRLYVARFSPDQRGINNLIVAEFGRMGLQATTGLDIDAPKDVDAVVTYRDQWRWDITMYMLELRVFIRAPQTDQLLAMGTSHHTSLSRKTPEEMVAEVLGNIFGKAKREGPRAE